MNTDGHGLRIDFSMTMTMTMTMTIHTWSFLRRQESLCYAPRYETVERFLPAQE
jgi:hypothetical protein